MAEQDAEPAGDETSKVYSPSSDFTMAAMTSLCLLPSDVMRTVSLGVKALPFLYLSKVATINNEQQDPGTNAVANSPQ